SWMIGFDGLLDKVTKSTEPIRSEIHIGAFWYEYTMHYIASIQRIRMYLREITKRKEMEEELQKSNEDLEQRVQERTGELSDAYETLAKERQRLYDILESFPYMVCLLAPDYHVVFANKKFRETFGESGGKRCYKCCHGDRTEPCGSCESFTPLKTGQPHQWEAVAPNGRVIAAYDVPFTDADGSPMILEFDMDITEHRKMEQQLRQSQKMEAIGTLAGGIAHDFNNILAGILGFAEMAFEDAEGQRQIQKSLSYILKATKRGKDLVKQILSFSRKTDYQRSPVPVTPVIKETIKLLRASIPATIDLRLSATAQTDTVVASPTELQQIIMNLSTNAFKAMEDKGGVLDISLSDALYPYLAGDLEHSGEYLQLMVKDTGVGMTPEVMRKAFDPFFTTSEPGKGTGMGLSVVYGIVRNLNGEITVSSEPGDGSIFTVFLPKTVAGTEKKEDVTSELLGGNETILYVEDEQLLNELGKTVLEKLGYMVHAFDDPEKALLAFSQNPSDFDLVITDHAMPKMSGSELAWGIRNLKRDIPIIMCTGYQEPMTPEKAKEIGIADILSKPLRKQELAAAVRRVLDQEKLSQ
ncbi:MAG TPA: ATP-binding protein, partial [Syntrophorhabdaceae bacterium]|nr:ATP-binding protein [Syntrophorhabdaceae bacterium]